MPGQEMAQNSRIIPTGIQNRISNLVSRKERAELLKAGVASKDIESMYIRFNHFIVVGVNWQD